MAILKSVAGYFIAGVTHSVSTLVVTDVANQKKVTHHPAFKEEDRDYGPVEIELVVGMRFELLGDITLDQVSYAAICEGRLPMLLKGSPNDDLFATARCLKTWKEGDQWYLQTQNATYRLEGIEKRYGVAYAMKFLGQQLTRLARRLARNTRQLTRF